MADVIAFRNIYLAYWDDINTVKA